MTPEQLKSRIGSPMRWVCIRLYVLYIGLCFRLSAKTRHKGMSNDQKTY